MTASSRSPMAPHDNANTFNRHPRHAHHRARFPSLSEFPDSPSVYSHAYQSPDIDAHSLLPDPHGRLDLRDETASTIRPLPAEDVQDDSDIDDSTDDASHRISLQGPKIRFHSRAPWETDDVLPHAEGSDNSPRSGTFGSKLKGTAARADGLIRTFARGSSLTSRPSVDSARSQASGTSFEITAGDYSGSRGVLYDLARQSMSTTSLSSSAASTSIHIHSSARTTNYPEPSPYFSQTHSSLSRATLSLDGMAHPSFPLETAPMRPSSSDTSRIPHERNAKQFPVRLSQERHSLHDAFVHPYANPDLVIPYTPSSETIPSHHLISGDMSGSDSNCTVTDSISARSATFSAISTEASTTSLPSHDLSQRNPRVNGKEISPPISVLRQNDTSFVGRNTRFLSLHPPPPGFDGPQRSNPTVTLLTLQEAQARERLRSNTVHTAVARQKMPVSNADDIPETARDQKEETDTAGNAARTRARSISAGNHQKTVPLAPTQSRVTEPTEESTAATSANAISGRALKHKKSGFMRLFGGRNSEGEKEKSPPPPALPHGDRYDEHTSQVHVAGKPAKLTRPRVAKPSSSPTLRGPSASNPALALTDSTSLGGGGLDSGKGPSPRRRQAPSLSIVTKMSDQHVTPSVAGLGSPTSLNFTLPLPLSLTVPQSAPPGDTDFPGLQLRPVSGSFSSHFADIVAGVTDDLQRDVRTPSSAASSSTALSPFTPVSIRRSDDAPATAIETIGEEDLTIKGLQDQLVSAKKAWQQQVWELRGQIRDLEAELEGLRAADIQEYCEVCGRGEPPECHASPLDELQPKFGVVNRPRVRTGDGARFVNGS